MRNRSVWLLAGLVLVASLIIGPGATASPQKATAGTVVFIHDQEPPNLQGPWVGNNLYATSLVLNNIWYGCQIRDATAALVPRLCVAKPKVTKANPLTVQLEYKKERGLERRQARRRRGPLGDVAGLRQPEEQRHQPHRLGGHQERHPWQRQEGHRRLQEELRRLGGPGLQRPVPAHIIKGKDMNDMFLNSVPVSSGPWLFDSLQKGVQITVKKNPRFKAGPAMKLDRLVFRYILDTNSRFQALKAGEGQAMEPQPQLQIAEFMKDSKFKVDTKVGYTYEHIDIQFGKDGHPALKQPYVRQALIHGMNRPQVAGVAVRRDLQGPAGSAEPRRTSRSRRPYRKNFAVRRFSQTKVISLLKSKGCTGGPDKPSKGNDKIFSCPNVGKLSFRFHTTTGNQLRALTFEIIQQQLKSVGIELVPRFQTGGVMFGTTLPVA